MTISAPSSSIPSLLVENGAISPSPAPPSNSGGLLPPLQLPQSLHVLSPTFSVLVHHSLSRLSSHAFLGFWFEDILKTWPGARFLKTPGTSRVRKARGVLPNMSYIVMCRCEGYGFQAVYSSIGYINQSVWV